jgi:multiple sugar transport system substrate-binding protein
MNMIDRNFYQWYSVVQFIILLYGSYIELQINLTCIAAILSGRMVYARNGGYRAKKRSRSTFFDFSKIHLETKIMTSKNMSRRKFLLAAATTGIGLAAAASSIESVLAADATPTPAPSPTPLPLPKGQAGQLTVIHKTEYFAEVQNLFREVVTKYAAGKNIKLDISTANPELFGDFTAKMLAAVQAGNPPDLGYHVLSIPQMHALDIVEDVTDVVEKAKSLYGSVVPVTAENNGKLDGKWWAVPFMSVSPCWFARKDVFEAAKIDVKTIDTWDKRREAALAVSNPDKKMWGWGLTVNRSGDGHGFILNVIQSFGGSFTDKSGLKVIFNSPETIAAVEWLKDTYTNPKYAPMLPPGVASWTDSSNNEAYLAGTIALTLNQPSIYAKAKADKNPVFEKTALLHSPKALDGRLLEAGTSGWLTIFKGAKNIDAAKDLILTLLDPANFVPMAQLGGGLFLPAYKSLWNDKLLAADPNFAVLQEIMFNPEPYLGRSHPAQPSALIDAVDGAGVTSQMMANIIANGMNVKDAVADAHKKIVQIFEEGGVKQN